MKKTSVITKTVTGVFARVSLFLIYDILFIVLWPDRANTGLAFGVSAGIWFLDLIVDLLLHFTIDDHRALPLTIVTSVCIAIVVLTTLLLVAIGAGLKATGLTLAIEGILNVAAVGTIWACTNDAHYLPTVTTEF